MKILMRILTIITLLLLIVIGSLYLFLSSDYVIKPLTKIIKNETGISLSIGNIDYNPLYPDTILLKNVSADTFFSADQIYIEFDYKKIIDHQLNIKDLEIINASIDIDKIPEIKNLGTIIQSSYIQKLRVKNFNANSENLHLDNGIVEIKNLNFYDNGSFIKPNNTLITLFADRIKYDDFILHSVNTIAHINSERIRFEEFHTNYKDAYLSSKFSIYMKDKKTIVEKLNIKNLDLATDTSILDLIEDWNIEINNAILEKCNLFNKNQKLFVDGVNLNINNIAINHNILSQINAIGSIESFRFDDVIINNISTNIHRNSENQKFKILMSGQSFDGTFETYIKYLPQTKTLTINDLSGQSLRFHSLNNFDFKEFINSLPFEQVIIKLVNLQNIIYDSLDENNPIMLRNGNIFLEHLKFDKDRIYAENIKSHIEISANELSFTYVNLNKINIDAIFNEDGELYIRNAYALVNNGDFSITGSIDLPNNNININTKGEHIDFNIINLLLNKKDIIGTSDFLLNISGKPNIKLAKIDGWIHLSNTLFTNLDFNKLISSSNKNFSIQWTNATDTTENTIVKDAKFNISSSDNKLNINGVIDSVHKKYLITSCLSEDPNIETLEISEINEINE